MKKVAALIIVPLIYIFVLSLKTGVMPKELKPAKVTSLFKSGDSGLFNNYQPISALEKIVYV